MLNFASKGISTKKTPSGPSDPFYSNVSVLMHMDGANNATSTTDQKGHAVTFSGNCHLSNTQVKFGSTSLFFDGGSAPSGVSVACVAAGTSDFTLEFWVNFISLASNDVFVDCRPSLTEGPYFTLAVLGGAWAFYTSSATKITGGSAPVINTWYHVALSRTGTTTSMFINGTLIGSFTDTINYSASNFGLGYNSKSPGGGINTNGYIDDFRYTPGVGRYTANFTPPTAAFPDH